MESDFILKNDIESMVTSSEILVNSDCTSKLVRYIVLGRLIVRTDFWNLKVFLLDTH